LFETIKHLPKKSRTARKALPAINIEDNALVTYFRKGRLEKFYIGTKNEANEIDFITTAKLFEAIPETKKYPILSTFYDLLAQNKKQMEADLQDVEIQVEDVRGGGKDNAIRVLKILKSKEVRMYKGFTEDAEQFIKDVIKLLEEGSLAKNLTKRIFTELKDEVQPLKIFGVLKKNIPDDYFRGTKTINDEAKYSAREVILSECFIK
jgi:rubrerythrin